MKKISLAILLSAFVATPALADNTGRFYIAGDLGSATYSNMDPFPNPGVFRIAGGYHFSPALAVEVGYSKFGDSTVTIVGFGSATVSASSFQVAAVGSLPLNPQFDLIGKLGLASNSETDSVTIPGVGNASGSYSQSDLLIGFGAQYHINSQVSVRLQYDNYGKFDNYPSPMKASSISLGVAYDF
ncbi:MAG TPA: porin family protein [Gallionella sp.]